MLHVHISECGLCADHEEPCEVRLQHMQARAEHASLHAMWSSVLQILLGGKVCCRSTQ
jgi:hypothetical protein